MKKTTFFLFLIGIAFMFACSKRKSVTAEIGALHSAEIYFGSNNDEPYILDPDEINILNSILMKIQIFKDESLVPKRSMIENIEIRFIEKEKYPERDFIFINMNQDNYTGKPYAMLNRNSKLFLIENGDELIKFAERLRKKYSS